MHQFFGLPSEFVRPNGPYGPFLSDPKIYFDWASGRWFVTELEIDQDPVTGDFTGRSHVLIAVSATSNPVGSYAIYVLDTTNDGTSGTPSHADCPCFGDQPLIGADANGFYISTNEFPLFAAGFNGAQIYALDKAALVAFGGPNVVLFSPGALAEGIAYSVQPAVVPPGGSYESANGGTQYFLSSLEFFGGLDNRIAVWAMTNTSSLASSPSLTLQKVVVQNTLIYGQPPAAQQPNISVSQICSDSLFMVVGCGLLDGSLEGFPISVKAPLIQSNDDRMNQVTFAAGKLWGAVNTVVKAKNGPTRTAAAWMAFTPGFSGSTLTASYAGGGYVAVNNSSVLFPSLAVNAAGQGAIGFSLVGATGWPSTAYAKVSLSGGATAVKVTAQGAFPDDGFTGYPVFDNRTGRWGDYSAASIGPDGNVWMANEYIPYANRSLLANWGTFVHHVAP